MREEGRTASVDAALVGTVIIWAVNFSVVKAALVHLSPLAFNSVRLIGASAVLLVLARLRGGPRLRRQDLLRLLLLALIGHTIYQLLFIHGIHETTASSSAMLLGMTPVFVALLSVLLRVERPRSTTWLGVAISAVGVGLVMRDSHRLGHGASGDWLTLGATLCWSLYTVLGKPVVDYYGHFKPNAYTMALGTTFLLPLGLPRLFEVSPEAVPASAWGATIFSFVFALVIAYSLWYFAVSRIGPTQTAIYANLTPVAALAVAWWSLGEPVGPLKLGGAALIILGIRLVRRH
ncbi:MAG TPA: EamA family transporter [Vicinamibacteria bacterium]|nr:EamA family transporter [Vicinamibacteria bacterium]